MQKALKLLFILVLLGGTKAYAQEQPTGFTIENYYKIKWGHADDFIALWKKNHYPLHKKLKEKGDVISIKAETPIIHSS